jgi:beta-galactosidase
MRQLRYTLLLIVALLVFGNAEARQIFNLNNGWRFFFTSENSSDEARYVRIPHTWNSDAMSSLQLHQAVGNYRRSLYIPAEWKNKRIYIRFAGVQSVANLFVNGQHAGEHRGGWTAFTFDITDKVICGGDNTVLVMVRLRVLYAARPAAPRPLFGA